MNTTNHKLKIYVTALVLVFTACGLQAGGRHYSKPRDIDRALLITDIVLRALIPTQTIVVQPQPVVTYTTPVYHSTTTIVTTPSTIFTPVYSSPVYVSPTFYYTYPVRYDAYRQGRYDHCRPAPRWYSPPRHYQQSQRQTNRAPQGRNPRR